jgi:hypothetical protein
MSEPKRKEDVDDLLDEMSKESFPASDAPQLDGLERVGAPAANAVPKHPAEQAPPPEVPDPPPSGREPGVLSERYRIGDAAITLRTVNDRFEIGLDENPTTLDAAGVEELISLIERHRPSLHGER